MNPIISTKLTTSPLWEPQLSNWALYKVTKRPDPWNILFTILEKYRITGKKQK